MAANYDLLYYSGYGTHYLPLAKALERPERARSVDLGGDPPDELRRLGRLMRLDLRRLEALPSWLGELRHLRMLSSASPTLTRVPDVVWTLPKLREVYLETPALADLDGLAASTSIRTVFFGRTPLGADQAKVDAIVAANPGSKYSMGFLQIARTPKAPPKDKAALVRALNDDTLDDWTDLSGVDLSGATFEDCLFLQKLSGANLRGATFRRCDFSLVELAGADLSEAVFEDCYLDLSMRPAANVVARGIRFERCALRLTWPGASIPGAKFVALEASPRLDLDGADAQHMELDVVCYESSLNVSLLKADLRGARITFDIPASRRKELEVKPGSKKVKWAELDLKEATTDGATSIVYTPLPAKPAKEKKPAKGKKAAKAGFELDEHGPSAPALARLDAPNASLWLLAIDARAAAAWTGSDGKDFDRALDVDEGPIDVGDAEGVIAQVGDSGWSHVWKVAGGVALIGHRRSGHTRTMEPDALVQAVGRRVAQFPVGQTDTLGTLEITSGSLALLLPFASGTFTAEELAQGASAPVNAGAERVLVPLPSGTYQVLVHRFAPEQGYEDELGAYGACVRIVKAS